MTQYEKLPEELLDSEGYPTKEWISFIEQYKPDKSLPIENFVGFVLVDGWHMQEWGFRLGKKYRGKRKLELHTGGWSGNEDIIGAILSNISLTHFEMIYTMWRAGGHYYFEIKC